MCKHAVKKLSFIITYVPDQYKAQEMFLTATKIKKCAIKPLIIMHRHQNSSLIATRLKKYVIKPSILHAVQYNSFLNAIRSTKMHDKAVDTCLFVFNSIRD